MPRPFKEAERERIRERLIAAGKKSINRLGIKYVAVDEIAREAGISKGSFYSFFPSREDFILSVFETWETEYRGSLLAEVAQFPGTARDRLERFFLGVFEVFEREPGLAKISFGEIERLVEGLPPERIAQHQARDKQVLFSAFTQWVEANLIDPALLPALESLTQALFAIAVHREDFAAGSFEPASRLIAEALAMRIAAGPKGGTP